MDCFSFAAGFVVCVVLGIVPLGIGLWLTERRERKAYVASLTDKEREQLKRYLTLFWGWRKFREFREAEKVSEAEDASRAR